MQQEPEQLLILDQKLELKSTFYDLKVGYTVTI